MSAFVSQSLEPGSFEAPASGTFCIGFSAKRAVLEPQIRSLRLVADEDEVLDISTLQREFPTVLVERAGSCNPHDVVIDDFAWRGAFDFCPFDETIAQARSSSIAVRGIDAAGVACEVMARYQRLVVRRNRASSTVLFDAVLDAHAALFDSSDPVIETDFEHALDTWQWMLRMDADAGLVPQLAALFHDVDRLAGDTQERIEHRAHRSLDGAPMKEGGERAASVLRLAGVAEQDVVRVRDLIAGRVQGEKDAALLDDADGLSFLSLLSPRYADYFGLAQTRRKATFTLGRLSPAAREKVALLRLRPDVDRLVQSA